MRKCAKLSQTEVGDLLKLHQTAIHRIESGEQNILIHDLHSFADFFGVKIDNILSTRINYWELAKRFNQDVPLPTRYRTLVHSRVREVMPLLSFVRKNFDPVVFEKLMSTHGLEEFYFENPTAQLGTLCNLDLLHYSLKEGLLTEKNFPQLIQETRSTATVEDLETTFRAQKFSVPLLQSLILNAPLYEQNFEYTIQELQKNSLTVSIHPRDHMIEMPYKDAVLGDFLCRYKKQMFSEFPKLIDHRSCKVEETECHFHGSSQCVYKIVAA